jgi:hypothetical protein
VNAPHDDEAFSARERLALDAWRVPAPGEDFAARVVARLEPERAAARGARPLALAAVAAMLVGGFFATRLFTGAGSTWGEVRALPGDGGSSAEVSGPGDGVRS